MFGQGSPQLGGLDLGNASSCRKHTGALGCAARWAALGFVFLAIVVGDSNVVVAEQLRVRVAWGEGAPRQWRGGLRLEQGRVLEVRSLGLTPDSPGSALISGDGAAVDIREAGPRVYDGIDVLIDAPLDAMLRFSLQTGNERPVEVSSTLRELATNSAGRRVDLDQAGNRVLMQRSPGDALRLRWERDSVVMKTGESVEFDVQPHLLIAAANSELLCRVRLLQGDDERASFESPIKLDANGGSVGVPFQFTMPKIEGVFAIELSLRRRARVPWLPSTQVESRRVQVVLIDPQRPTPSPVGWTEVDGFDPTNQGWFDRVARIPGFNRIPGSPLTPVESATPRTRTVDGQEMSEVAVGGWVAYPLSISPERMHLPHLLEVEYPASGAQSFSVSILEPNRANEVADKNVDSGVTIRDRWVDDDETVERHRLLFWPRTANPFVMIANRHPTAPAVFGRIRVLAGPDRIDEFAAESLEKNSLPPMSSDADGARPAMLDERMVAAFFGRPSFAECFGSDQAADPSRPPHGALDDWYTFYRGGARLAQYLRFAGYNTAIVCVARDGGALYPSRQLQPNPRYDNGVFFRSGQDPMRKDVLEMLFRIFDREGVRLIPALHLSGSTPRLEALRRSGERGVVLEALGGATRFNSALPAPYYNPLDVRVQEQTLEIVREIVKRYSGHRSFGGVAIQSSAETWTQLPDAFLGLDPVTIARFTRETNGPAIQAGEEQKLLNGALRSEWLNWRAQNLAVFHRRLSGEVEQSRRGAKLILATEDVLQSPMLRGANKPRPGHSEVLREQLLRVGLDPKLYGGGPSVLMRPYRFTANGNVAFDANNIMLNQPSSLDSTFGGVQFHHERSLLALPEFDEKDVFGDARSAVQLRSVFAPSGQDARRRYARAFGAQDVKFVIDGGEALPLGQEHSTRGYLQLLRSLPATPAEDVYNPQIAGRAPAVVRQQSVAGGTGLYAVNKAPWPLEIRVELSAPINSNTRAVPGVKTGEILFEAADVWTWRASLPPYGVAAIVLPQGVGARVWSSFKPNVVDGRLRRRIENVQRRAASKNRQAAYKPLNLSFEKQGDSTPEAGIPDWRFATGANFQVDIQPDGPARVLHLRNSDPNGAVLWSRSSRFKPPETGMLAVRVRLRSNGKTQPRLAVAVDTEPDQTYYQPLFVGKGTPEPINAQWQDYPFLFKVPPNLKQLSIGFDLHGEGEVWIDRIEVFDIWLDPDRNALTLHSGMAKSELVRGNAFECQLFLESYWPQFLMQHDPTATPRAARAPAARGWFPKLPRAF